MKFPKPFVRKDRKYMDWVKSLGFCCVIQNMILRGMTIQSNPLMRIIDPHHTVKKDDRSVVNISRYFHTLIDSMPYDNFVEMTGYRWKEEFPALVQRLNKEYTDQCQKNQS